MNSFYLISDALGELDHAVNISKSYKMSSSLSVLAKSVPIGIAQSLEDKQKQMRRPLVIESDDEVSI